MRWLKMRLLLVHERVGSRGMRFAALSVWFTGFALTFILTSQSSCVDGLVPVQDL